MTNPEFNLTVAWDDHHHLYAKTTAINHKYIWRTTESYSTLRNLCKALKYIVKPKNIIIEENNLTIKQRLRMLETIHKVWQ